MLYYTNLLLFAKYISLFGALFSSHFLSVLLGSPLTLCHILCSEEETRTIFRTLMETHFIPPLSLTNANQDGIEKVLSSEVIRKRSNEEAMRSLLTSIVAITVEVQENLRSMFLPTPERSHYIFTLNNLCIMFR